MKYTPRSKQDTSFGPKPESAISLPPLPFSIPAAVMDETRPTAPPVRRKMRVMKRVVARTERPVFDHGEVGL